MIELLSIKHVSNIIAIDFNYYEPESLVHNYWYPKFCAIYSSTLAPSGREINLHQIYLRTGAGKPTVIQFNEDDTSHGKVKDLYLDVLGMPGCAQLHYKKDQIEACPLGWTRLFYMFSDGKLRYTSIIATHHGKENN